MTEIAGTEIKSDSVLNLLEGSEVFYGNKIWVILRFNNLVEVLIRSLHGERRETKVVNVSELTSIPKEQPQETILTPDVDLDVVSDSDWDTARSRLKLVKLLLSTTRNRTAVATKAAAEAGFTVAMVYRWRNAYLVNEKLSSLLPTRRPGGRGRGRLDPKVENIIAKELYGLHSLSETGITQVHESVKAICHAKGLPLPCLRTFQLRVDWADQMELYKARKGRKAAEARYDHVKENTIRALHPLAIVQIDHAVVDVIVVHDITREPIYRAWLTLAIDVFSRVIVGYYLALDHPSATSVGACIAHAILPKEEYLRKLDVPIQWPVWGVMKIVHTDNGADFRGDRIRKSFEEYGIEHQFRPVTKPHYGAHIERLIGTFAKRFRLLPGATTNKPSKAKEFNPEKTASMTMLELERWLLEEINKYHHTEHNGIDKDTPLQRYENGLLQPKDGMVRGLPPRRTDVERVKIDFLPEEERTIQNDGVNIDGRIYWSDALYPWLGRRSKDNPNKNPLYRFKVDDRDVSAVYFFDPEVKRWFRVPSKYTAAVLASRAQFKAERKALQKKSGTNPAQHEVYDSINRQRRIITDAIQKTQSVKSVAPAKKKALKNDQKHRDTKRRTATVDAAIKSTETSGFKLPDLNDLPDVTGKF
ncbi:transposase [Undibacterium sp. Di27W]|uniref:transposase n=1 Tax=Undibacterium sp. Di27W TaxID=3413036 RepID=UPI003BF33C20